MGVSSRTYRSPPKTPKMAMMAASRKQERLPPEVSRILYIRNLPYKIENDEMYDIFGKYGAIRQIRIGNTGETRGTAYVVYEDIYDAKAACEHLSGFNVLGRYLIVVYYNAQKRFAQEAELAKRQEDIDAIRKKLDMNREDKEQQNKLGGIKR